MNISINRSIRVAVIQCRSILGQPETNFDNAYRWLEVAAADGAQLALLPELMPSGYSITPQVWQYAEPPYGPTFNWLRETARKFDLFLGTSFIEAVDGHFYNSFVLMRPDGTSLGRVRKEHAETYLFKNVPGANHVLETEIGRIAVGICGDNQYASLIPELIAKDADLILMPHAWPVPRQVAGPVTEQDIQRQHELAANTAPFYARSLGIPALFCNQAGPVNGGKGIGIVGSFMNADSYYFPGLSTICDSDGAVLAQLDHEEGVAVETVHLDPSRKKRQAPPAYGKWVIPGPKMRDVIFGIDGAAGKLWYHTNTRRGRLSRRIETQV